MPPRDRIGDLPDPRLQGALEPVLIEVAMHAQKRVLAELARVVGVPDHAVDNVPTEPLMVADQRLERAARAGQYGGHQQPIGVDGVWLARPDPVGFDDRWLPWTHPVIDTPNRPSVASPPQRRVLQPPAEAPYLLLSGPGHTGRPLRRAITCVSKY